MTTPDGLQERGTALWEALGAELASPRGAIALEACRIADRLDEIDNVIAGKGVLNLLRFRLTSQFSEGDERTLNVKVEFANVLAEARQQAVSLTALLTKLGLGDAASKTEESSPLATILSLVQSGAKP